MVRRAFAELVGAQGNPGFRLGDIDYLSSLWDTAGYRDGLVHRDSNVPWQEPWKSGTNRGDNWLSRGFLDAAGTFGPAQYQAALDQGYTAPQIYQAMPGAISPTRDRGLRNISEDLRGPHGQFYKDLERNRGTWLTGYQNVGGTFGERSYDEVSKLVAAGERIQSPARGHDPSLFKAVPNTNPAFGEKITPKTIWDAREGVNRIGPEARRLLIQDLQQGIPLRHRGAPGVTSSHRGDDWAQGRGYLYNDPGQTDAFGMKDYDQLAPQDVSLREMRSIADTKSRIGTGAAKKLWNYTDPGDTPGAFGMADVRQLEDQGVSRATMRKIEAGMDTLGPKARDHLYGMNINAPTMNAPAKLPNQGYNVGKSATGIRRQNPKAMTNRNAKGTWGRGSQFFKDASTY